MTQVKLIDFGLATPLIETQFRQMPPIFFEYVSGTHNYMAPELFSPEGCTGNLTKIDTWSLAVVVINLLTGGEFTF